MKARTLEMRVLAAALLLAAGAGAALAGAARADDYDVSPELAWKAACQAFAGEVRHFHANSRLARVSEAKAFYSYDGTMKYYAVYLFAGRERMPTWRELERDPEGRTKNGWFRSVIVNGTKKLPPCFAMQGGPPGVVCQREEAKRRFLAEHPGEGWRYSRAVVELMDCYFVFKSASKEVLVNVVGEVVDPAAVSFRPDAAALAATEAARRAKWEEIENYERDEKIWTFVGPLSFSP